MMHGARFGRRNLLYDHIRGIVARLSFDGLVAQQHRCSPPGDGRRWTHVASGSDAGPQERTYVCPECGASFASLSLPSKADGVSPP